MEVQAVLGSDIAMAFDECSPYPCSYEDAVAAVERTDPVGGALSAGAVALQGR